MTPKSSRVVTATCRHRPSSCGCSEKLRRRSARRPPQKRPPRQSASFPRRITASSSTCATLCVSYATAMKPNIGRGFSSHVGRRGRHVHMRPSAAPRMSVGPIKEQTNVRWMHAVAVQVCLCSLSGFSSRDLGVLCSLLCLPRHTLAQGPTGLCVPPCRRIMRTGPETARRLAASRQPSQR